MNAQGMIDIRGIDKVPLMKALWENTCTVGMGVFQAPSEFPTERAEERVAKSQRNGVDLDLDYLYGRPIKMNLSDDFVDPGLYERDAGEGTAARVVAELRDR